DEKLLPIRDKKKIPTHGGRATGYSLWQRSVMVVGFWLWLGFKCGRVPLVEGRGGGDSDGGVDGGEVVVVVVRVRFQTKKEIASLTMDDSGDVVIDIDYEFLTPKWLT
nr:hypothetical protein [Tanacetum cinerariifolium]